MTEPIDVDQPAAPPWTARRWLPWAIAGVVVALAAGVAIGAVLTRPDGKPQATAGTAAPTSPTAAASPDDVLGRSACKAVFTPEILAPDTLKTMSEKDWQAWARDVQRIADSAAFSSNREVARAGEDLQFELKGDRFVPAFVQDAAERLRDACDRVDYINIPSR